MAAILSQPEFDNVKWQAHTSADLTSEINTFFTD